MRARKFPRFAAQRMRAAVGCTMESMETRRLFAVITVTTATDSVIPNDGFVSLREAISAINTGNNLGDPDIIAQSPGTFGTNDAIHFNIPGSGVQTIHVGADATAMGIPLPNVVKPVVIDATTQPGFDTSTHVPVVELDGTSAGNNPGSVGFELLNGGTTIRGFVINRFGGDGIFIGMGNGNTIAGNYIGTDSTGEMASPNSSDGIDVQNSSDDTIGGGAAADRNVISANPSGGIDMEFVASNTVIEGNYIGTDAAGTMALATQPEGISFSASGNNNLIGGTTAGAGNIISGNTGDGLVVGGAPDIVIQGNYIGTNAAGTAAIANGDKGILLQAPGTIIGGITPGAGNLISGNKDNGIALTASAGEVSISGNLIGTDVTGALPLGNGANGILVASSHNVIGGSLGSAANIIAFNTSNGLAISQGTENSIRLNSIFSNGALGIDLNGDGLTHNDPGDSDTGANDLQNFPILASAVSSAGSTTIAGVLNSNANSLYLIDFYSNSAPDPSGFGEGQTYLGSIPLLTDSNGNALFNATLPVAVPSGAYVSATATTASTAPDGETSEFAQDVQVVGPPVSVSASGTTITGTEGRGFTKTVASFTSTDPNDVATNYSVSINWGDSTTGGGTVVSDGNGHFHVSAFHRYAEEKPSGYAVKVTIHRTTGGNTIANSTAKIADAPLDQAVGLTVSKSVNVAFSNVTLGSFRDQDSLNTAASDYVGTIDWGDGTAKTAAKFVFNGSTLDVGSFWKVQGSHKYTTKKTFTVKITVHDNASPSVNLVITAMVKVT